jgi:hypothetical protein
MGLDLRVLDLDILRDPKHGYLDAQERSGHDDIKIKTTQNLGQRDEPGNRGISFLG